MELPSPRPAFASGLVVPAAGSADAAVAGTSIAEPLTPLGAQLSNPAGLAGFEDRQIGGGLGLAFGKGVVTATMPEGYQATNNVTVPFLESFLAVPWKRFTFGLSTMGTSGAKFQYGARPGLGVDDGFYSESGVMSVPAGFGFRVTDQLWVGAQLSLLYGTTHLRYSKEVAEYPGAATPFHYSVSGFGLQGALGVTWKPLQDWSLGLSYKPPGKIWADGDSRINPTTKQDVEIDLNAPQEAAVGVTHTMWTRWKASYAYRFIDTSRLRDSYFHFQKTPSANSPFLPAARDEHRHAIGLQYAWSESLTMLGGFAKANGIVGDKGISPMSYDSRDLRLTAGLRWLDESWIVDGTFGYLFAGDRHVSPQDALVFPGKYDSRPAYLLSVTITRKF